MIRFITSVFVALLLAACGGDPEPGTAPGGAKAPTDFSPVIARVGDVELTRAYFDFRYENLAPGEKGRYSGEDWENRFLDKLVEEILVSERAEAEGYDRIRDVEYRLDMSRRAILSKAYHDRNFQERLEVPEQAISDYYQANADQFRTLGRVLGYHVQCSSESKIRQAYAELQKGTRWDVVVAEFSEDPNSRENAGQLGWFNRDGYVLGMGFVPAFTQRAFEMEAKAISEPFRVGENWHILRTAGRQDEQMQPLSEVRDRIVATIRPTIAREAFESHVRRLGEETKIQYFGIFAERENRSADQLYRLGGESVNPHARLDYYQKLVDLFPEHERADDALFMIGFINSESFADPGMGSRAFRRLLEKYPDSEFAESAQFMLGNLGRSNPDLRGEQSPAGADEARQRIESIQK